MSDAWQMSPNATVVVTDDVVSGDLGSEVVMLHLRKGMYYGLDAVGATIWNLIQKPRLLSEIRETLIREYEVEPGRCESDLIALLKDLADHGLVKISP